LLFEHLKLLLYGFLTGATLQIFYDKQVTLI